MRRLTAIFGGLVAVLSIPLALAAPTAWVLVVAHLGFTAIATVGAALEGLAGHGERARLWGLFYLVATVLMVATLEFAATERGAGTSYWAAPWLAALLWGWIPPVIAGLGGLFGEERARALTRRAVRRRRRLDG